MVCGKMIGGGVFLLVVLVRVRNWGSSSFRKVMQSDPCGGQSEGSKLQRA